MTIKALLWEAEIEYLSRPRSVSTIYKRPGVVLGWLLTADSCFKSPGCRSHFTKCHSPAVLLHNDKLPHFSRCFEKGAFLRGHGQLNP